jgi:hypothetical protein
VLAQLGRLAVLGRLGGLGLFWRRRRHGAVL